MASALQVNNHSCTGGGTALNRVYDARNVYYSEHIQQDDLPHHSNNWLEQFLPVRSP